MIVIVLAYVTGSLTTLLRFNGALAVQAKRINDLELSVSEKYVKSSDFKDFITRFEEHMLRIENKLDRNQQLYINSRHGTKHDSSEQGDS